MMTTNEIRESFLEFFKSKEHKILPSSKLIPDNDNSLMFTIAGMVPFKEYFNGSKKSEYDRVATCQKCLRISGSHGDIDELGKTTRHLTFFEMLGNFSFGWYGTDGGIDLALEYLTDYLKLDVDNFFATVHKDDQHTYLGWVLSNIDNSKIIWMGDETNFWGPTGDEGVCGPCTEILYDRGESIDPNATIEIDPNERFLEIWNIVNIDYYKYANGRKELLQRPPFIDTGMGLERIASIVQKKDSVFEIDSIYPIVKKLEEISGKKYKDNLIPFRIIVDHIRSIAFLMSENIYPDKNRHGYVVRKLIRRALYYGRVLEINEPFLFDLHDVVINTLPTYHELTNNLYMIIKMICIEEAQFNKTLDKGLILIDKLISSQKEITGKDINFLYDTHGFPPDLAVDIMKEKGINISYKDYLDSIKSK